MSRQGPRSEPTAWTRAMVAVLSDAMEDQGISRHQLALMVVGKVSRSQLYDVLANKRVMDFAELETVTRALDLKVGEVVREAERRANGLPPRRPHPPQGHQSDQTA